MSETYELLCPETKTRIWIGQGNSQIMTTLYFGQMSTMAALQKFFNINRNKPIYFTSTNESELYDPDYDFTKVEVE